MDCTQVDSIMGKQFWVTVEVIYQLNCVCIEIVKINNFGRK